MAAMPLHGRLVLDSVWLTAAGSTGPQLVICRIDHKQATSRPLQQYLLHDAATGSTVQLPELHLDPAAVMHGSSQLLVVDRASPDSLLRWQVIDAGTGQCCHQWDQDYWSWAGPTGILPARARHLIFSLQPDGHVAVTNARTLLTERCHPMLSFNAEGLSRAPAQNDIRRNIIEAAASPDGSMLAVALAIPEVDHGQGDRAWVQILDMTSGACMLKLQCYQPTLSWSPTKALLAVRGCADLEASKNLDKTCWIMNASSLKSLHLNAGDAHYGHAHWAPCGELLVLVWLPKFSPEANRVCVTAFDAVTGIAIWSSKWSPPALPATHPSSMWAVPASWSQVIAAPHIPIRPRRRSAFFHASGVLVQFQRADQGQWTMEESPVYDFAPRPAPQLDPSGHIIVGVDRGSHDQQILVHHDIQQGKRHVIFKHQLPESRCPGMMVWCPILPGWSPIYAYIYSSSRSDGPSLVCIAIVDACKHQVAHFCTVPELESCSGDGSTEDIKLCWSPNGRHLLITNISTLKSVVISWPAQNSQN